MKKLITLLSAVLITASIWAQSPQKMSYQAVIRDASNALVTNTAIGMQISILQTTSTGTAVYVETQTPTTNVNGLVSIEIGTGTVVSGTFSTIDWSAGPYFIKTETDTTGGTTYTITGTSQLLSVPYALYALSAEDTKSANNGLTVDGNIVIDNGGGWHRSYGATGWYNGTYGGGIYMKNSTWVEVYSKSFLVPSGTFQVGSTGNGTFKVTNGGVMTYTDGNQGLDKVLTSDANGVATWKTNISASGLEKITDGWTGWRLIGQNLANYGNIGPNAVDLSYSNSASSTKGATQSYAFAIGLNTTASGTSSIAMGNSSTASGSYSFAIGISNTASNTSSMALGNNSTASGIASTSMGASSIASGKFSTAMGNSTKAKSYASVAIGQYNIGASTDPLNWVTADPLFEIGNGTSDASRSNALTVYKIGNTDVNGVFRAQNNIWPSTGAGVEIAYDTTLGKGYVQSYDRSTSTWNQLFLGASAVSPVTDNFTWLGTSTNRWLKVYAVNGTIQTSDRRLKKEINNIKYGLNTIMKLRSVSYKWKKGNQDLNLGLIAQEVQKVIPEVIDVGTDKAKTLGMKYTELIPVLIKGMQEQQKEITELKKMVNKLLQRKILVSAN